MGASNWATCPRCFRHAQEKYQADLTSVMSAYGKIPVEAFDAQRSALEIPHAEDYRTFREDYEVLGAESGTVTVKYHGECSKWRDPRKACGLELDFEFDKDIPDADA